MALADMRPSTPVLTSNESLMDVRREYAELVKERLSPSSSSLPDSGDPSNLAAILTKALEDSLEAHKQLLAAEEAALQEANRHAMGYRRSLSLALQAKATAKLVERRREGFRTLQDKLVGAQGKQLVQEEEAPSTGDSPGTTTPRNAPPTSLTIDPMPPSLVVEEDPPSPASTAQGQSPIPAEHRRHAGHTPRPQSMVAGTAEKREGEVTPKAGYFGTFAGPSSEIPNFPPPRDEKVLKGPLCLTPDPNSDPTRLELLTERLQEAVENPEIAKPNVVRVAEERDAKYQFAIATGATKSELEGPPGPPADPLHNENTPVKNSGSLSTQLQSKDGSSSVLSPEGNLSPGQDQQQDQQDPEAHDGWPRLRTQPSLNFGVPFGSLGHFNMRKNSEDQ